MCNYVYLVMDFLPGDHVVAGNTPNERHGIIYFPDDVKMRDCRVYSVDMIQKQLCRSPNVCMFSFIFHFLFSFFLFSAIKYCLLTFIIQFRSMARNRSCAYNRLSTQPCDPQLKRFKNCRGDARASDLTQFLVPAHPRLPVTWHNKAQGCFCHSLQDTGCQHKGCI